MQTSEATNEVVHAINEWAAQRSELVDHSPSGKKYVQFRWDSVRWRKAVLQVFPTQGNPAGKVDLAFLAWSDTGFAPLLAAARTDLASAGIVIEGTKVVKLHHLENDARRQQFFAVLGRFLDAAER